LVKSHQLHKLLDRGDLAEAQTMLHALLATTERERVSQIYRSFIPPRELSLLYRTGELTEVLAAERLQMVCSLGVRVSVRGCLSILARWRQDQGNHHGALKAFGDLIALANEVGAPSLPYYEASRALSLAALGRREEAQRVAAKVDHGKKPPHISLALLYLELGDQAKAREHALAGYKDAWGEGPPYHDHWDLEDCRKVLAAVGEPEPPLAPFDPSKVEPFDFEPDVERLIEKKLAEKAKAAEEKAKRDAARPAPATKH
jgi:hypothetical protein